MRAFDKKFGPDFLAQVPASPGVYLIFNADDTLIYVGKAKNLRRRLSQYRNAKRRKKHAKMRKIVEEAARVEIKGCGTELDAFLEETRLIQGHRPKWNVAGAFYFLYPMIGIRQTGDAVEFCYTHRPESCPDFQLHGAYRSRWITGEAFFALMRLLAYIGHRHLRKRAEKRERGSYVFRYRQLPERWIASLSAFLKGESASAMEELVLLLLENAGARRRAAVIQEDLDCLKKFWKHEVLTLSAARRQSEHAQYPVGQRDRDILFLKAQKKRKDLRAIALRQLASQVPSP